MSAKDILLEASNLTNEQKMDAWHNGTRHEAIGACGEAKLIDFFNICIRKNYLSEAKIILDQMRIKIQDPSRVNAYRNTYDQAVWRQQQATKQQQTSQSAGSTGKHIFTFTPEYFDIDDAKLVIDYDNDPKILTDHAVAVGVLDLHRRLISYIVFAVLLDCNNARQYLIDYLAKDKYITTEELKANINQLLADAHIMAKLDNIKNKLKPDQADMSTATSAAPSAATPTMQASNPISVTPAGKNHVGYYRLATYSTNYTPPARQHLIFRKFDRTTGKYNIGIEGQPRMSPWSNEPLFDSVQQAHDFAANISMLNTKRDISKFIFKITNKPMNYGGAPTDLSSCKLVDTVLGPAYMQANCTYKESLEQDSGENLIEDTEKIKDHKWTNKGKDGAHGTFSTKKAADAQRKAMFANGYHEGMNELVDEYSADLEEGFIFPKAIEDICNKYDVEATVIGKNRFKILVSDKKLRFDIYDCDELRNMDPLRLELERDGIIVTVDKQSKWEALVEKIEKHDELNPKLWNGTELKPEVSDKIHEMVDMFLDELSEDGIKFKVKDVILIGSNCSYNYNPDSDLDVHIVADTKSLECPDNLYPLLYSAYRSIFNDKHHISFYDIPVELYVETEGMKTVSNGIYSVKNGKWIKEPVEEDIPELDKDEFDAELKKWKGRFEGVVDKARKQLSEGGETGSYDDICAFIDDLYECRRKSIQEDENGEYGTGNLVFKELRNEGCLDMLKELRTSLEDQELSLEESVRYLRGREYYEYRDKLSRAAHEQVLLNENGIFEIYNVRASDAQYIVNSLRQLDFVEDVHASESGKYDFSRFNPAGMPQKYFTIRGTIKEPTQGQLGEGIFDGIKLDKINKFKEKCKTLVPDLIRKIGIWAAYDIGRRFELHGINITPRTSRLDDSAFSLQSTSPSKDWKDTPMNVDLVIEAANFSGEKMDLVKALKLTAGDISDNIKRAGASMPDENKPQLDVTDTQLGDKGEHGNCPTALCSLSLKFTPRTLSQLFMRNNVTQKPLAESCDKE